MIAVQLHSDIVIIVHFPIPKYIFEWFSRWHLQCLQQNNNPDRMKTSLTVEQNML